MVKLKMFLGSFDWALDQRELNCEREKLVAWEKNEPWQTNWDWSLFSCLERKSLRTSFVELYISYWTLVWLFVNFQRSLIASFGEFFNAFRWTVWHWVNLMEAGMTFRPNLLRVKNTGHNNNIRLLIIIYGYLLRVIIIIIIMIIIIIIIILYLPRLT